MLIKPSTKSAICIIATTLLSLSGCGETETASTPSTANVRPVKILSVSPDTSQQVSRFPAVVNDKQLVELSFLSGGKVVEFAVHAAQSLNKGQLIAKLEPRELQNQLATATAQFKNAEKEYKRALSLIKTNAIAQTTLLQRETEREVSLAKLNSARKALEDAELLAPFDGIVAETLIEQGQFVSAGQTVVKFIGATTMQAAINLPANYLAELHRNENKPIEASIILDSAKDTRLPARYKSAVLLADKATQTYRLTFEYTVPKGVLSLPGMNASIEILIPNKLQTGQFSVPATAISSDADGTYVWIVAPQNMLVSKRYITLAQGVGEWLTATSGLQQGDQIVTTGAAYLYEGMQVREWQQP